MPAHLPGWQRSALVAEHAALATLAHAAREIVLWAGARVSEQALPRRVHWWLRDADVLVSERVLPAADHDDARLLQCVGVQATPFLALLSQAMADGRSGAVYRRVAV